MPLAADEQDFDDWRFGLGLDEPYEAPVLKITGPALGRIGFEAMNLNNPKLQTLERLERLSGLTGPALLPSPTSCSRQR